MRRQAPFTVHRFAVTRWCVTVAVHRNNKPHPPHRPAVQTGLEPFTVDCITASPFFQDKRHRPRARTKEEGKTPWSNGGDTGRERAASSSSIAEKGPYKNPASASNRVIFSSSPSLSSWNKNNNIKKVYEVCALG